MPHYQCPLPPFYNASIDLDLCQNLGHTLTSTHDSTADQISFDDPTSPTSSSESSAVDYPSYGYNTAPPDPFDPVLFYNHEYVLPFTIPCLTDVALLQSAACNFFPSHSATPPSYAPQEESQSQIMHYDYAEIGRGLWHETPVGISQPSPSALKLDEAHVCPSSLAEALGTRHTFGNGTGMDIPLNNSHVPGSSGRRYLPSCGGPEQPEVHQTDYPNVLLVEQEAHVGPGSRLRQYESVEYGPSGYSLELALNGKIDSARMVDAHSPAFRDVPGMKMSFHYQIVGLRPYTRQVNVLRTKRGKNICVTKAQLATLCAQELQRLMDRCKKERKDFPYHATISRLVLMKVVRTSKGSLQPHIGVRQPAGAPFSRGSC